MFEKNTNTSHAQNYKHFILMLLDKWKLLGVVMSNRKVQPSAERVMYALLNRENSKTKALFLAMND